MEVNSNKILRNSNPEYMRKTKSEESFMNSNKLSIHDNDENMNRKHSEVYKINLRKSMESISNSKGYEPVYKQYRYQPEFKPLTTWAIAQRQINETKSNSSLNSQTLPNPKKNRYSYDGTKYGIYGMDFAKSTNEEITKSDDKLFFNKDYSRTKLHNRITSSEDKLETGFTFSERNEKYINAEEQKTTSTVLPVKPKVQSIHLKDRDGSGNEIIIIPNEDDDGLVEQKIESETNNDKDKSNISIERLDSISSDSKTEDIVIVYPLKEERNSVTFDDRVQIRQQSNDTSADLADNERKSKKITSLHWKWNKKTYTKHEEVPVVLSEVEKYQNTNIPKFLVLCIKYLNKRELLNTKGIYRTSPNYELIKEIMKKAINDKNYIDIELTTDGVLLTALIKNFLKNITTPLLKSVDIDEKLRDEHFKDKLILNELDTDMVQVLKEIINSLSPNSIEIFLFFILHIEDIEKHKMENLMDYPNLSRVLSPCLFYNKSSQNFDMFILSSNQSLLLQVIFENYKKLFDEFILKEIQDIYEKLSNDEQKDSFVPLSGDVQDNHVISPTQSNKSFNFGFSLANITSKLKNVSKPSKTQSDVPISLPVKDKSNAVFYSSNETVPEQNGTVSTEDVETREVQTNGEEENESVTMKEEEQQLVPQTTVPTINEDPIKENFSFARNKRINIENVNKQKDTNIPELVYNIVQTLTIQHLNQSEKIYEKNMNFEEMQAFVEMLQRRNEDELKRFNNGNHLAYFLKEYIKLFQPPLLKNQIPGFEIYEQMTNDIKKINIAKIKYSEYINWIEPLPAKQTFMFLIKHLNDVANEYDLNGMTPNSLAQIWSHCLFSDEYASDLKTIQFLEYSIMHYKKLLSPSDLETITNIYKTFYDPINLPFPVSKTSTHCCSIS